MAVERAQLEVASPSEDDVRAADRLPSTPPPPPPPSLHRLHPSPVLYCESQRQPGRVSVVCVHARCVFVAADQCQLGGGRWYLIPPPTSPPLCICPSQFEQRFFFFFFFFSCLSSSTHSLIQREDTRPFHTICSFSATVELIKLLLQVLFCVYACVCSCLGLESAVVVVFGDLRCVK